MAETALITGFPRLLARGLARRVLNDDPHNRVLLLVSPDDHEAAVDFERRLPPGQRTRIERLEGQLLHTDLGLSADEVRRVLATTTLVFHTATLQAGPRSVLRRHNVGGLVALLRLARDIRTLRRFCFFSSAFVSGDRTGTIHEEDLDCGQRLRTAYERTLVAAEKVAREVMPRLPITIFRPGAILGHSRTGEADSLDEGPNYLVRLLVNLPAEVPLFLPGSGVVPLNIVPIDYVVRAACALALMPESAGRTFHLTDPNPLSARQAFEILSELTHRSTPFAGWLPTRMVKQLLKLPGLERLAPHKLALFENLNTHVVYDCSGALELLANSGVVCPPFESYADQLISWVASYERENRRGETFSVPPAPVS